MRAGLVLFKRGSGHHNPPGERAEQQQQQQQQRILDAGNETSRQLFLQSAEPICSVPPPHMHVDAFQDNNKDNVCSWGLRPALRSGIQIYRYTVGRESVSVSYRGSAPNTAAAAWTSMQLGTRDPAAADTSSKQVHSRC